MLIGRVHEMVPPAELFANPQTPELKQFLSSIHG
jgi:polar amino acid transport system ATP-binding protein